MRKEFRFIIRWILVDVLIVVPLTFVVEHYLKVEAGSGRDNLLFYSFLAFFGYFLVYRPLYGKKAMEAEAIAADEKVDAERAARMAKFVEENKVKDIETPEDK